MSVCNYLTLSKDSQPNFMAGELEFLEDLEDDQEEDRTEDREMVA